MKRRNFLQTLAYSSLAAGAVSVIPNHARSANGFTKNRAAKPHRFGDGRDWFFEKRFGLFVHWGLYAIPGWHEQHQYRAKVERSEYVKLQSQWDPHQFDPDKWLDLLEKTGMKYLTVTAKHCDGFCLWDTKQTAFNTMNSPYGKDIIRMIADACHRRKIPLCLYYSIVDWNNPNYPNQGRAHELQPQPQDSPDQEKYVEFVRDQVRELCTNYGEIHGFWWDANRLGLVDPSINNMIRELQPKAVINNRGFDEGDFSTPERDYDKDDQITFDRPVEACQAVGMESWGYRKNEDYYNDRHLIRSIDKYLARGANYLLNVGPDPLGVIPKESRRILKNIGKWYNSVQESLEMAEPASPLTSNKNVMLTSRGNTLYVHLNKDPEGNVVKLRPFTVAPQSAVLLNNGKKVAFELEPAPQDHITQKPYLRLINLPTNEMCNTVLVIKLEFDRPPKEYVQPVASPDKIQDKQK
jgi:alpha-L-fucosidase